MSNPLSPDKIMQRFQESWRKLPDYRKPNNNTKYEVADAALGAYLFLARGKCTKRPSKKLPNVSTVVLDGRLKSDQ